MTMTDACDVESCDRPRVCKGYCAGHYERLRRTGDLQVHKPLAPFKNLKPKTPCKLKSCDRLSKSLGLCNTHYLRWQRKGDVLEDVPINHKNLHYEGGMTRLTENPRAYIRVAIPGHPLGDGEGRVMIHRAVLYNRIGPGVHPCHWCSTPLIWKMHNEATTKGSLLADHVDGDTLNHDSENLVPACSRCNSMRARAGNPADWLPPELVAA